MGTYGDLMKLNQPAQAETVEPPETKPEGALSPAPVQAERKKPKSRHRDTKQPRHHATTTPRYHDTVIEMIRTAVKAFGKEAATHRFTPEEKKAIADIVYAYRQTGIRTSENEISRIGVNFLVEDYRKNGENSVLHKVLKALNG
jgi:hypothetical protein